MRLGRKSGGQIWHKYMDPKKWPEKPLLHQQGDDMHCVAMVLYVMVLYVVNFVFLVELVVAMAAARFYRVVALSAAALAVAGVAEAILN